MSNMTEKKGKGKRKHIEDVPSSSTTYKINFNPSPENAEGPILLTFSGAEPPPSTKFSLYKRADQRDPKRARQCILTGETDKILWTGENFGPERSTEFHCEYLVAVCDKQNNTLTIQPTPPIFSMRCNIKALADKYQDAMRVTNLENRFNEAKNSLGDSFGTKKVRQRIRAEERNRVEASLLHGEVANLMTDEIFENSQKMPTKEALKEEADSQRPIPPFNAAAVIPELVYLVKDIISEFEMNLLPVKELLKAVGEEGSIDEQLSPYLGMKKSEYINTRMKRLLTTPGKKDRQRLRILLYISYLFAFRMLTHKQLNNPQEVRKAVGEHCSQLIIDELFKKFTEPVIGHNRVKCTPFFKDKIFCYAFALCLHVDDFSTEYQTLENDLSLGNIKTVSLIKALGCTTRLLSSEEQQKHKLSPHAQKIRVACLKLPLNFPIQMKRRK